MTQRLHRHIKAATAAYAKAERQLNETVAKVQAACAHRRVAETPWSECGAARRICLTCGLEELGSHWSGGSTWSRHDFARPAPLGNDPARDVIVVESRDEFYRLRVGTLLPPYPGVSA
jgi:hypothetical protein